MDTSPNPAPDGWLAVRPSGDADARRAGPGAAVAGFYSYREITRTHGIRGLHDQALVVLAVAELR